MSGWRVDNNVYKVLHLWGYYDGIEKVSVIEDGLEDANILIAQIKPATPLNWPLIKKLKIYLELYDKKFISTFANGFHVL